MPERFALVTGATPGGIGAALVEELHARGYTTFACGRTTSKLESLRREGVEIVELDVTRQDSIDKAARTVADRSKGRLHVLVNNAGVHPLLTPAIDFDIDDVRQAFETNVFGPMAVTKAFAPLLVKTAAKEKKEHVRIVNIGSSAGSGQAMPWASAYAATKAAINVWSKSLRLELALLNVGVVTVTPGVVVSSMTQGVHAEEHTAFKAPPSSFYAKVWDKIVENRNKALLGGGLQKTDQFSRYVLDRVLVASPVPVVWGGGGAFGTWMGQIVPGRALDGIVNRVFGLHSLPKIEVQ